MYNKEIIINASNIGIKFDLHSNKRPTFKQLITERKLPKKEFWALQNISFIVQKGEILGIIGLNGSGKSTLLRVIAGIFAPDKGTIDVKGHVSTLFSLTTGFQPELSGRDNIYLIGMFMGLTSGEIKKHFMDIVNFSELKDFINVPVKNYSSGMIARLGFSIVAHLKSDILLIDEILGAGDQGFREKSQRKIYKFIEKGHTVVLVSHNMKAILKLSTKVLWLHKGKIMKYGEPQQVVESYKRFISINKFLK